jgi:hypothetical protein
MYINDKAKTPNYTLYCAVYDLEVTAQDEELDRTHMMHDRDRCEFSFQAQNGSNPRHTVV